MSNFDTQHKTLGIFLDLSKAFDTVSHQILLERLDSIGVRGIPLELIKSFLCERLQKVKIGSIYSDPLPVEFGVPQGTVLGPTLFTIYIDELTKLTNNAKIICFADDTVVLVSSKTWNETYKKAEHVIGYVKNWLDDSLLTLNTQKTYFITFTMTAAMQPNQDCLTVHNRRCDMVDACSCEIKISKTDCIKYLGIFID